MGALMISLWNLLSNLSSASVWSYNNLNHDQQGMNFRKCKVQLVNRLGCWNSYPAEDTRTTHVKTCLALLTIINSMQFPLKFIFGWKQALQEWQSVKVRRGSRPLYERAAGVYGALPCDNEPAESLCVRIRGRTNMVTLLVSTTDRLTRWKKMRPSSDTWKKPHICRPQYSWGTWLMSLQCHS